MSTDRTTTVHGSPQPEIYREVAIPSSNLEMPDEVAGQPVSKNEASFFKEHGYLVKRGLLKRASL